MLLRQLCKLRGSLFDRDVVLGWGTTSYSGTPSDILLEVLLPIWNRTECQAVYTQPISDLQLCAGYKQGGKDSCQVIFLFLLASFTFIHLVLCMKGDSGGPLMYQMSNGRWASVGVVSWGTKITEIFTLISHEYHLIPFTRRYPVR